MQERRQHLRITTPVLVEFTNPHTQTPERSFTQDISEGGACFPTSAKLQVGDALTVLLSLPFQETAMRATGEIVWVREIARLGGIQYEVGVRFAWTEDPDRQRLSRSLATFTPAKN